MPQLLDHRMRTHTGTRPGSNHPNRLSSDATTPQPQDATAHQTPPGSDFSVSHLPIRIRSPERRTPPCQTIPGRVLLAEPGWASSCAPGRRILCQRLHPEWPIENRLKARQEVSRYHRVRAFPKGLRRPKTRSTAKLDRKRHPTEGRHRSPEKSAPPTQNNSHKAVDKSDANLPETPGSAPR